jgi:S-DNA-T family DNA segregation ATPase FtsK/SpoIIIE
MELRYKSLQKKGLKKSTESDIYIIFDEFGDLITTNKKQVEPLIIRLAQLGRAANIHLILATQNPSRKVITAGIKVNIDAAVALRCREPLESRMIIGCKGAELLPKHSQAFYLSPDYLQPQLVSIPLTPETEINQRIEFWRKQYKKNYPITSRL